MPFKTSFAERSIVDFLYLKCIIPKSKKSDGRCALLGGEESLGFTEKRRQITSGRSLTALTASAEEN